MSSVSELRGSRGRPGSTGHDGQTRIAVTFDAKGDAKSTATLEHSRLADADEAKRMKDFWRERMAALKSHLEGR